MSAALVGDDVVLVTGGVRGIGRAIVERSADDGAMVALTSRDLDAARAAAAEVSARTGVRVVGYACDVRDEAQVQATVTAVTADLGGLTRLVANAGTVTIESVDRLSGAAWRSALETNLLGPALLASAAAPHLAASGRGRLLLLSSANALVGFAGRAAYAASKSGLTGLVRALAAELGPRGVTVNAVAPGPVATELLLELGQRDPGYLDRLQAMVPVGRLAEPAEIAEVVAFLGSSRAGYINGQVLAVDGGMTVTRAAGDASA